MMVRLNAQIDIKADPKRVFSLIQDVDMTTRLNPRTKVLGIHKLTSGYMDVGSQYYYRLIVEGKMLEHQTTCTVYEPGKVMEMVSNTKPSFSVRVSCEPIPGGTRLKHEESFDIEPVSWPVPKANGWLGKLFVKMFGDKDLLIQTPESIANDEEEILYRLQPSLFSWMKKIKKHVEDKKGGFYA